MSLVEQKRVETSEPDTRTPHFGRSIVAVAEDAADVRARIRAVWSVVASWGRWCDEDLGDWPDVEDAVNALPVWFADIESAGGGIVERGEWLSAERWRALETLTCH